MKKNKTNIDDICSNIDLSILIIEEEINKLKILVKIGPYEYKINSNIENVTIFTKVLSTKNVEKTKDELKPIKDKSKIKTDDSTVKPYTSTVSEYGAIITIVTTLIILAIYNTVIFNKLLCKNKIDDTKVQNIKNIDN